VKYRHIAVEGPIGAGKTSLARRLAEHLEGDLLLEDAVDNPFLPRFYQDSKRYALATQLYFLFSRTAQLREAMREALFRRPLVTDYLLEKDQIFARINLDEDELVLYQRVYGDLKLQVPVPDLVIYLQAHPSTLLDRVRRRGIDFERLISEAYLVRLAEGYSRFFNQFDAAPVLIVNSDNLDFAHSQEDFDLLLERMSAMRSSREFFNRAA
jgi:deoxyguanosine kinase